MRHLNRVLGAAALVCAVSVHDAGAQATGSQTAPPPATPTQRATAAPASPDAAILADFNSRLDRYVTLQRSVGTDTPPLAETKDPQRIIVAQELLAAKIRNLRKEAKQGDIFSPQVAALFRRLMAPELRGTEGQETRATIAEDAPPAVPLTINSKYPQTQPLSTVPANVLARLPRLPEDVEYRFVGRHLILRDVDANIIVDYVPNAIR